MIETVLGPIRPEEIKSCMAHEHFTVYGSTEAAIAVRGQALEIIVPELQKLRRDYGCNTLVECTNTASVGRDLETCAEIARQARFHVIASTGFFTAPTSPWWMLDASVSQLVERWKHEARHGMDGTGIRPGVLKAASGFEISDRRRRHHDLVRRWFEAIARAHHETGLPITTHGWAPQCLPHFDLLTSYGVPPQAIAHGHADSQAQLHHVLPVAERGGFLIINFCGGFGPPHFQRALRLIKDLVDRGHADRVMLSVDKNYKVQIREMQRTLPHRVFSTDTRAYAHLYTHVVPKLEQMGVTRRQLLQMLRHNPRRHLSRR